MPGVSGTEHRRPDDWPTEPERRYARHQAQLAEQVGLEVTSRTLETASAGRIHFLDAGEPDGEPVLLLHGATGQAAYWLPLAHALADRYRLVLPDLPGEGLSAKVSFRGRDHRRFLVAYLNELLDALELGRPHVVGNSFGGAQALLLAIDHDRVDRLCLVGAPVGLSRAFPIAIRLMSVRGLDRILEWLLHRGDPIDNAREWVGLFVEDVSAIPDPFWALYATRRELPGLPASVRSLTRELGRFGRVRPLLEFRDEVAGIERPTGFVWGTEDFYWPPTLGRSVTAEMAAAELHELPGAGHIPWLEPGDEAQQLVRSFLDG